MSWRPLHDTSWLALRAARHRLDPDAVLWADGDGVADVQRVLIGLQCKCVALVHSRERDFRLLQQNGGRFASLPVQGYGWRDVGHAVTCKCAGKERAPLKRDRTVTAKRVPMQARTPSPKGIQPCCGRAAASGVPSRKRSGRKRSGSCSKLALLFLAGPELTSPRSGGSHRRVQQRRRLPRQGLLVSQCTT